MNRPGTQSTNKAKQTKRRRDGGRISQDSEAVRAERDFFGDDHDPFEGGRGLGAASSWHRDDPTGGVSSSFAAGHRHGHSDSDSDSDSSNSSCGDSGASKRQKVVGFVDTSAASMTLTSSLSGGDGFVGNALSAAGDIDEQELHGEQDLEEEKQTTNTSDFARCWGCRQAAFSAGLHDKGRYADLSRLVQRLSSAVSRDRLVEAVEYYYEAEIRYQGGEDQGEWAKAEISRHLFDHMTDMSLEAVNQVHEIRKLSRYLQKRMLVVDEDGVVSVDSKNVQTYLKVNAYLLKAFGAPTHRGFAFNPDLTLHSSTNNSS